MDTNGNSYIAVSSVATKSKCSFCGCSVGLKLSPLDSQIFHTPLHSVLCTTYCDLVYTSVSTGPSLGPGLARGLKDNDLHLYLPYPVYQTLGAHPIPTSMVANKCPLFQILLMKPPKAMCTDQFCAWQIAQWLIRMNMGFLLLSLCHLANSPGCKGGSWSGPVAKKGLSPATLKTDDTCAHLPVA